MAAINDQLLQHLGSSSNAEISHWQGVGARLLILA